jgi:hypothetical protein
MAPIAGRSASIFFVRGEIDDRRNAKATWQSA